jgi:dTDP-4-amino-4,6-dideoxygalactose transaminase
MAAHGEVPLRMSELSNPMSLPPLLADPGHVSFPPAFVESYLAEVRTLLESGATAEGRYFRGDCEPFVEGRLSLPVCSGGAALLALLAFYREKQGKNVVLVQSNTTRALYAVPRLLNMTPIVADSSYDDFLGMRPEALKEALRHRSLARRTVVVYSVIGGYLSPSLRQIAEICEQADVPLIIDGAHAQCLDAIHQLPEVDVTYSFSATKLLPAGEGGLIVSSSRKRIDWLRRFASYDRIENALECGLNLRASELTSAFMHRLMTDQSLVAHFKLVRLRVAERYRNICIANDVRYLDPLAAADYNGYRFVVLSPHSDVAALDTALTEHRPTSAVFATDVYGEATTLPHWCPPTY